MSISALLAETCVFYVKAAFWVIGLFEVTLSIIPCRLLNHF
ncbi:hypothetical protein VCR14J2_270179 [Vibrio coralliirubri]|nr:hypothetical protein VCR14J2_270179 [Vibrio coralliirubri]